PCMNAWTSPRTPHQRRFAAPSVDACVRRRPSSFEPVSAAPAHAYLAAGVVNRRANPRRIPALRVERHHVGAVDRPLLLDHAAELAAAMHVAARARPLVELLSV